MREIAQSVLESLDVLHSSLPPVVHGCLKPSQVLFSADGRPKVAFGLEQRLRVNLRGCQARAVRGSRVGAPPGTEAGDAVDAAVGSACAVGSSEGRRPALGEQSPAVDIFDL